LGHKKILKQLAKHTLKIEDDYDFVLIGISSHEKEYRICWALNNKFKFEFKKIESLEIKGKKQLTPSFFSLFLYVDEDNFKEYFVLANLSESKSVDAKNFTLFEEEAKQDQSTENEWLVPEYKQMNYFFVVKGDIEQDELDEIMGKIKEIDMVLTAVDIDVEQLKSKHNLIF
jgi:hypothetical protein